jgi:hypothetical protein
MMIQTPALRLFVPALNELAYILVLAFYEM